MEGIEVEKNIQEIEGELTDLGEMALDAHVVADHKFKKLSSSTIQWS